MTSRGIEARGAVLAAALLASAPASAGAPEWCASYKPSGQDHAKWAERAIQNGDWSERTLNLIAMAACEKPDDAAVQEKVSAWRKQWMERVGTTDAEDREAMALRVDAASFEKKGEELCAAADKKLKEARAPDFARAQSILALAGCAEVHEAVPFWVDNALQPSEIERAAIALQCSVGMDGDEELQKADRMTKYLLCGMDARALDKAKLERELQDPSLTPVARVKIREAFGFAKKKLDRATAFYKAQGEKNPALKKILFDAPEQAAEAWKKAYAKNKAAYDEALAIQTAFDVGDKAGLSGCGAKLRKRVTALVKAKKPKTLEAASELFDDPMGHRLLSALIDCETHEGNALAAATLRQLLENARLHRGPRFAGYWAGIDAITKLPKKGEEAGFDLRYLRGPPVDDGYLKSKGPDPQIQWDQGEGLVQSVKPKGKDVLVTFKKTMVTVPVQDCKQTDRIVRIEPTGAIIWDYDCKITGWTKEERTPKPALVPKAFATGIKGGVYLRIQADLRSDPRLGFPTEIYAKGDKKKLLGLYGMKL